MYIDAIRIKKNNIDYQSFPFCLPVIRNLNRLELDSSVTFFVGDNGTGKSTLIEAIAIAYGLNPEGGSRNMRFKTYDSHSSLSEYITIEKGAYVPKDKYFLRAETLYNLSNEVEALQLYDAYGGSSLHSMSHGESFLTIIKNRFFGKGLYIMDEPESALSPVGLMSLLCCIHDLVKNRKSQFIIATHSPILTAYPKASILQFNEYGIESVSYEQSELVCLYKSFMNNTMMIEELLKDSEEL